MSSHEVTLADHVRDWKPEPVTVRDTISEGPVGALAGLLDQVVPEEHLPPLWHWVYFIDRVPQSALGEDGHPREAGFLPPIPDRRRMFAGGRLALHAPFRIGSIVRRESSLASVTPKTGRSGELLFTTVRHEYTQGATLLAVEEQDIVYRIGDAPRGAAQTLEAADTTAPWSLEIVTDPVLLFRFSALTYNAHRIHYDLPYTVEVEGHEGLVVHGPVLAMLLAELPRRAGIAVESLEFRLKAPLYCGRPAKAVGGPGEELKVIGPSGVHATMRIGST